MSRKLMIQANNASIRAFDNPSVKSHTDAYHANKRAFEAAKDNTNADKDWTASGMEHHFKHLSDVDKAAHKKFASRPENKEYFTKKSLKESMTVKDLLNRAKDVITNPVKAADAEYKKPILTKKFELTKKKNEEELVEEEKYTHKKVIKEYGAKVRGLGSPSVSFKHYLGDDEGNLNKVTQKQYSKSGLPDKTSENTKKEHLDHLRSKIVQFNKKVEHNSWVKSHNPSYEEEVKKLSEEVDFGAASKSFGKVQPASKIVPKKSDKPSTKRYGAQDEPKEKDEKCEGEQMKKYTLKDLLGEAIVSVKDAKQLSGKRKTGVTVHAGVDYGFAKKHNQDPYFSVTHDHKEGNRWVSSGIAGKEHTRVAGNSPEDRTHLEAIRKVHLRSATTGEPMHGLANAEHHAGIGKYAPEGGHVEHLASHLGISHEHAGNIIKEVHGAKTDEQKKAIVAKHYEALKPKFKADAEAAHAAIAHLSAKYPVNHGTAKNESVLDEAGKDGQYHPKNPKIHLYHKDTGAYLASTNWSSTAKHAVSAYEAKHPDLVGKVKATRAKD